ncbi:MAG: FRG domain-containing protein [Chitinophagaceae bacterium]|nr:FRG domain-containing protein [Chitinophagaceae bacterium]
MEFFDTPDKHINSIKKFMEILSAHFYTSEFEPGKWMYRGQSNVEYKLKPSVGRLFPGENFDTEEKLLQFERDAFNEFQVLSYHELHERDLFIVLGVAQHHGLKTRLLDWTFSGLIALFFAVENENHWDKDGALFAFQSQFSFNLHAQTSKDPFNLKEEFDFLFLPIISPRISAQQAVFQLFRDPTKEFSEFNNLGKFRIPASSKKEIKKQLENLGITYKTLFPDLDGLCKTINYNKLNND